MRWTVLLVPVVVAACATADEGAGRLPATRAVAPESQVATPAGTRIERFDEVGLSFAVPEDWVTVDGIGTDELLDAAGDAGVLDGLADAGMSQDDVVELLGDAPSLTVASPDLGDAVRSNLTVVDLRLPGGVPSVVMIEAGIEATGAELLDSASGERAGLPAVEVRYRLSIGDVVLEGTSAYVEVDGRAVSLTVSSTDRAEADRVSELVLSTLDVPE